MSRFRATEIEAEEIVLGYLIENGGSSTALSLHGRMLQVGDESMTIRDVQAALNRCLASADVGLFVVSPVGSTYRITDAGRARLAGGRS